MVCHPPNVTWCYFLNKCHPYFDQISIPDVVKIWISVLVTMRSITSSDSCLWWWLVAVFLSCNDQLGGRDCQKSRLVHLVWVVKRNLFLMYKHCHPIHCVFYMFPHQHHPLSIQSNYNYKIGEQKVLHPFNKYMSVPNHQTAVKILNILLYRKVYFSSLNKSKERFCYFI